MAGYKKGEVSMGKKGTKNAMAGKIYKGSMNHIIYEAIMTHPKDTFTYKDVMGGLIKDHPNLSMSKLMNTVSRFIRMGLIERSKKTREASSGRKVSVFRRVEKAKQPLIYDPNAKDQLGNSKPKRKYKKKAPEIPEEIDATQLGAAMIDYLRYLQKKVRSLVLEVRDAKEKANTQVKEATRQVNIVRHEMDGLKKINEDLQTKLANKSRTFNTKDVLNFKRRKAQSGGLGT
jgi:hypothetical protein